ncbi:MAG: hypothetical protein ACLT4X_03120 [Phascolarctobacterium sp.]
MCEHGLGKVQVYVGENLSYPEEKITSGTRGNWCLAVSFFICNDDSQRGSTAFTPTVHGLADDLFMRKECL